MEFGADPESVKRVVTSCRRITKRALIAKLSPALADIPALARAAVQAGADGISVVNTMPGYLFDGAVPRLGRVDEAEAITRQACERKVKDSMPDIPVIGVGGVRSARDARQYLRAGAALVAIGTAQLADPRLPERIVRDLESQRG